MTMRWERLNCISVLWPQKMTNVNCLVVFLCGVVFSFLVLVVTSYFPSFKKIRHHLPSESVLQVRDDYHVRPSDAYPFFPELAADGPKRTATDDNAGNLQEALGSLKVALEMRSLGKDDKALRLFKHALALSPRHPEILIKYGEYLEHSRRDIVLADQLYFQALTVSPSHIEALANRERTATIVESIDQGRLDELDQKRDALSAIAETNSGLRRAKKEGYFQNIYHSAGIEGNTMSLSQTRSVLETRMAIGGKSVDEHNEILGLDAAMKFINASLVNKESFVTLKDILEIHRRVLGHVDPIEGGEFRTTQVYVGGHIPPGPGDLAIMMGRFEQWLNSELALSMHPVRYAALAHYKLVHIHPFTDGNGRTSRLLMNTILMRAGYPPVIIPKQQRHKYYDFLQLANEGDSRPFVRFIAECTEKTLDLYLWATSELSHQVPLLATEYSYDSSPLLSSINEFDGSGETIRIERTDDLN